MQPHSPANSPDGPLTPDNRERVVMSSETTIGAYFDADDFDEATPSLRNGFRHGT